MSAKETLVIIDKPQNLLQMPHLNKGTAFTLEERRAFHLMGLLPSHVSTIEEQVQSSYQYVSKLDDPLLKYDFLMALQDRNVTLFHRLMLEYPDEFLPIIYTPTVGQAAVYFSERYTESAGLYVNYSHKEYLEEIFESFPKSRVDVCVVSDGSRVLGLGDLGIGGHHITKGKCAIYSLFGGISPQFCLPITLDLGTNNERCTSNPHYLGEKHQRLPDEQYYDFMETFITKLKKRYPNILVQWEDFSKDHAAPLLDKYRTRVCSFNDDIQGTASVILAGLLAAMQSKGEVITEQKIGIFGGGSAGTGVAELLEAYMIQKGLSIDQIRSQIYIVDREGVVQDGQTCVSEATLKYACSKEEMESWCVEDRRRVTLEELIRNARVSVLLGVSAQPGVFTEDVVTAMCKVTERPVIFPLSNPTTKSEAYPEDLIRWSQGSAIIGTGSPFEPAEFRGQRYEISQCNNFYIFPAIGLAVSSLGIPTIPDELFLVAAESLASYSPNRLNSKKGLFPKASDLRDTTQKIALAIGEKAASLGLIPETTSEKIEAKIKEYTWHPTYKTYIKGS